jgi:hypothetical protein
VSGAFFMWLSLLTQFMYCMLFKRKRKKLAGAT